MSRSQKLYALGAFFSAAGLVSAFWQLLDKIELLKNPASSLSCNLNEVFNCGRVLTSHQYDIFGFPNAIIGIIMFTFFLSLMLTGFSGSRLNKRLMLAAQGLALFMLGFILWFLFESIFRIGAICLFCTIIGPSVLVINASMLRLNRAMAPLSVRKLMDHGADIFFWSLILLAAVFTALIKLA